MIDRNQHPIILPLEQFDIQVPQRSTLPNGVPLNVLNVGDKEVIRLDLVFEAGRLMQEKNLVALFTNRMLREGSGSMTGVQIAEKLDFYGAWLDLAVSTRFAYITLYSLSKYLEPVLQVLEKVVKEPLFPENELNIIAQTNLQQFLISQSRTDFLAQRSFMRAVYGKEHPFGKWVQADDYQRITPQVLHDFYERFYYSGNCMIFLSGKVTDACIRLVERSFGEKPFGIQEGKPRQREYISETSMSKRFFVEQPHAPQSTIRMGNLTIGCHHPDFCKMRVMLTLFGGYFGSRLMSNIREEKGYTYGISAGLLPYPDECLLMINADTATEYVESLIAEVYHEIDKLQQDKVPDAELDMVKNYMIGTLCRSYESPFSLADAWIYLENLGFPDSHFRENTQAIKDVTTDEIRELSRRYLCKENLKEVVSGKKMS